MDKDERQLTAQEDSLLAEDIRIWRQQLIRRVLRVMLVFGGLMVAAGAYATYTRGTLWATGTYIGIYAILVLLALWRRAPYVLQVGGIQLLLYTVSVVVFLTRGIGDSSRVYLLTMVFVSTLFLGWRAGLFTLILVGLTMVGMGWGFVGGYITHYTEVLSTDLGAWIPLTIEVLSMGVFIALMLTYYTFRFNAYMSRSRELSQALEENQASLEQEIAERTAALEKRTLQLEAATAVAREAAEIREVETLLTRTTRLISQRFGFYHTGIFLVNETGEYAVLRAVSSPEGERLLARGHRLRVGQVGVVGYVMERGEPRIAQDVSADEMYFDNPEMPQTRSELALPLRAGGAIIGVLDVQSVEPGAFTQEDVDVLQALADQLSVAIENARLIAEAQAAVEMTQRAYGEVSRSAWKELLRTREGLRISHDPRGILRHEGASRAGTKETDPEAHLDTFTLPLTVRGQVIGGLDAYIPEGKAWTAEQKQLLETLVDQLGVALESARLFEDTQRRAAREQLISNVTGRIRETLDMETMLRTAAEQMRQVLDLEDLVVRLATPEAVDDERVV